ncbi:MAG: hypothetical protein HC912_02175 [Saprospiraceae bacterium]|nr:hypothetical protein [Saprospiraceae bacterium]
MPKTETTPTTVAVPKIRNNVKRRSALDLQIILKEMKIYKGAVDGLYGDATAEAFTQATNTNEAFKKYKILSQHTIGFNETGTRNDATSLQTAIDNLWTTPTTALKTLESAKQPIAKAYRAYWIFQKVVPRPPSIP